MKTVEVVFDIPLDKTFDYLPGVFLDKISSGLRVRVPFGRQKKTGIVLSTSEKDTTENYKEILGIYDEYPLVTDELFSVAGYMTDRYFSSLGQSVFSILRGLPLRYKIDELHKAGISTSENLSGRGSGFQKEFILFSSESRKMEMYKVVVSSVRDGSVLFLTPEVSTAEIYYEWMSKLYGDRVVLFHGGLKNKEKINNWLKMLTVKNLIVLGTRLAVFSPLRDLKTVIIDNGHDFSYREQQTPKYDAVEISEFRCEHLQIPLIIGERCLSVKEYFDVKNGSAVLKTTDGDVLPAVYTVIVGKTHADKNIPFFSRDVVSIIEETVLRGEKVAIIHNRKGSSKVLKCEKCGNRFLCNSCGSPMVLTEDGKNIVCRFCKTVIPFNNKCPLCGSRRIGMKLYGIEKMFRTLKEQYPEMSISKFTRDTGEMNGEFDILVGTGIIRKVLGLYPFSLVIFVSGEAFLNISDYRSEERFFIMVNEIRAAVKNKNCRIIIQTRDPNLEVYKSLRENKPEIFYSKELSIRQQLRYSPFAEMIKIELKGKKKDVFERRKEAIETYLQEKEIEIVYSGVSFPPVKKGKNVWKYLLRAGKDFDREGLRKMSQNTGVTVESNPEQI